MSKSGNHPGEVSLGGGGVGGLSIPAIISLTLTMLKGKPEVWIVITDPQMS